MESWYAAGLAFMGLFLFVGAVTIFGAAVRDSTLEPGAEIDPALLRRGWIGSGVGALLLGVALWGGWSWWSDIDAAYRSAIFEPMPTAASVDASSGHRMNESPWWRSESGSVRNMPKSQCA